MKKWLAVIGILGLSVLTLAACGNKGDSKVSGEKQTITVATDSDTAPFTFKKGDDFKGYDMDLVKAVFKDSDKYEVKFVTTPFDSILTGVDSGRYQIAANDFNYNEERAQKYSFSMSISMPSRTFCPENSLVKFLILIISGHLQCQKCQSLQEP